MYLAYSSYSTNKKEDDFPKDIRHFSDVFVRRCSTDYVREIPKCLDTVKFKIMRSIDEFFHMWTGQPRSDFEWECYIEDERNATWYDTVEASYWDDVNVEIVYLRTIHEHFLRVNSVNNNLHKKPKLF